MMFHFSLCWSERRRGRKTREKGRRLGDWKGEEGGKDVGEKDGGRMDKNRKKRNVKKVERGGEGRRGEKKKGEETREGRTEGEERMTEKGKR